MDKKTLDTVGEWAQARVVSGEEPPWTYHKLKLFAEIAKDLANGMDVVASHGDNTDFSLENNDESCTKDGSCTKIVQMNDFRSFRQNGELVLPS